MSVKNKNTEEKWLLPFCIIEDATTGNVMAINTVMKHYEGYILRLSTREEKCMMNMETFITA